MHSVAMHQPVCGDCHYLPTVLIAVIVSASVKKVTTDGNLLPVSMSASCEAGTVERSECDTEIVPLACRSSSSELTRVRATHLAPGCRRSKRGPGCDASPPHNGCGDAHWSRYHASCHLCQLFGCVRHHGRQLENLDAIASIHRVLQVCVVILHPIAEIA